MAGAVKPTHLDLAPCARAAGSIALPGSKSISNRALLLAALARGETRLRGLLVADDVDRMEEALRALGVRLERDPLTGEVLVHGVAGEFPVRRAELFLGNAGTAFRPLTAALALGHGEYRLGGVPRMHERPIGDLVEALRALGAEVRYAGREGYPPLEIGPLADRGLPSRVRVRGDVSSQFLSALLMALPVVAGRAGRAVELEVEGELISKPYVAITTNLMARFGVTVAAADGGAFRVPASDGYVSPGTLLVEGDASAASYFLAAGAIAGGPVRVTGVGRRSIQGDVAFADALGRMGATIRWGDDWIEAESAGTLAGISQDCVAIPDAAMTLAVVALFAQGPTTLTGIASWRVKETDRIAAMAAELAKVGARVETGPDRIVVVPPARFAPATIDTYDDHRMAMCFSLVRFGGVPVRINDPGCVAKTFPGYFAAFGSICRSASPAAQA
jgi:3-phosphoshikimate 1-carboxyvinyltransferase